LLLQCFRSGDGRRTLSVVHESADFLVHSAVVHGAEHEGAELGVAGLRAASDVNVVAGAADDVVRGLSGVVGAGVGEGIGLVIGDEPAAVEQPATSRATTMVIATGEREARIRSSPVRCLWAE